MTGFSISVKLPVPIVGGRLSVRFERGRALENPKFKGELASWKFFPLKDRTGSLFL
jgi:hypothetical protein